MNKRATSWLLALALGVGAAAPVAMAKEEQVPLDKLPKPVRQEVQTETKGATEVAAYNVGDEGHDKGLYIVHYTDAQGKRMELRINGEGKVLRHGETRKQQVLDQEQALAAAKSAEEKAKLEQQYLAEREAQDRAQFEAMKAAHERDAAIAAAAHPTATPATPGANPSIQKPMGWEQLREVSEEYNATSRTHVALDALPPGPRKTLGNETNDNKQNDYYRYQVEGKTFFSAHTTTPSGRRLIIRTDEEGKLLGKRELTSPGQEATEARPAAGTEHHKEKGSK